MTASSGEIPYKERDAGLKSLRFGDRGPALTQSVDPRESVALGLSCARMGNAHLHGKQIIPVRTKAST